MIFLVFPGLSLFSPSFSFSLSRNSLSLTLSALSISTPPRTSPSSLSRCYELNHSLRILEIEPESLVHELRRRPASFEAISGQTTASWPACKFPATSEAFEAIFGQTTAIWTSCEVPFSSSLRGLQLSFFVSLDFVE
ncbi:hypothetical protein DVH24_020305 [Malus domestica]|uniref:Uncharacterized protein n=1 Tax=Malus domestica TaxID=3750 RepID=A0A498JBX1_MALDO|nr:hypothetical protein DVH24_020305 [Malus domestica]